MNVRASSITAAHSALSGSVSSCLHAVEPHLAKTRIRWLAAIWSERGRLDIPPKSRHVNDELGVLARPVTKSFVATEAFAWMPFRESLDHDCHLRGMSADQSIVTTRRSLVSLDSNREKAPPIADRPPPLMEARCPLRPSRRAHWDRTVPVARSPERWSIGSVPTPLILRVPRAVRITTVRLPWLQALTRALVGEIARRLAAEDLVVYLGAATGTWSNRRRRTQSRRRCSLLAA